MQTPAFSRCHRKSPYRVASCVLTVASAMTAMPSAAQSTPAELSSQDRAATADFKLTAGLYPMTGGDLPANRGIDLNLRHSSAVGNVWLGLYRAPSLPLTQTRAGWDSSFGWGPLRVMPSLQTASGGFWGGSLGVEAGERWYVGAGLGRTNLRSYVNLNFDPNDAWMLSGGYRWATGRSLGLQVVRDNRQNPDQQHVHLVYRAVLAQGRRMTLDLLYKSGQVDAATIHRAGLAATLDWPRHFVRLAYDPMVNFTPQTMWRLSTGIRF